MRSLVLVLVMLATTARAAEAPAEGRWIGEILVAGHPLRVVLDLTERVRGAWSGSITLPDLNVKGAPVTQIITSSTRTSFSVEGALGEAPDGKATFDGVFKGREVLEGTFQQGGNAARFVVRRSGDAQVELPLRSTAVDPALVGTWRGDYDLDGYPHHVTLTLANHAGAAASAEFVLVGKSEHKLAVDLIFEEEGLIRVESHEFGVAVEGRVRDGGTELRGLVEQGPSQAPIVLRRQLGAGA